MKRKQLKCANIMRENHLNITLSTVDLTYIYITKAKNSMNLIPESHILSGFYSYHIIYCHREFHIHKYNYELHSQDVCTHVGSLNHV